MSETEYTRLQTIAKQASENLRQYRISLAVKYGSDQNADYHCSRAEARKRQSLRNRADTTAKRFYAYLTGISPRDWSSSVPYHWIVENLTYADAITAGQLEVIPPPAYGYQPIDTRRFAEPIDRPATLGGGSAFVVTR